MIKFSSCLAALLFFGFTFQSHATNINLAADSTWNSFDVDNLTSQSSGLEWIDLNDGSALSFQFTLTKPTWLEIVDGGFAGDRFEIFDNGVSIGFTSVPFNSYPVSVGLDFDQAWADPAYSKGAFLLNAGLHSVTGVLSKSALDDVGAEINATVGAVRLLPEPASILLLLTGGGLMAAVRRRGLQ